VRVRLLENPVRSKVERQGLSFSIHLLNRVKGKNEEQGTRKVGRVAVEQHTASRVLISSYATGLAAEPASLE